MGQQSSVGKITAHDKAIFQLKQQRDKLRQFQNKHDELRKRQEALARTSVQEKQHEKARFYLRAKRHQESIITKSYDQIETLERLIGTIESKLVEKDVFESLTSGNILLKELNSEMSLEKVDQVMDDLEEERLKVDEVSDALASGSALAEADLLEIEEEFARLQREESQAEINDGLIVPELPEVPTSRILPNVPIISPSKKSGNTTTEDKRGEAPQLA